MNARLKHKSFHARSGVVADVFDVVLKFGLQSGQLLQFFNDMTVFGVAILVFQLKWVFGQVKKFPPHDTSQFSSFFIHSFCKKKQQNSVFVCYIYYASSLVEQNIEAFEFRCRKSDVRR